MTRFPSVFGVSFEGLQRGKQRKLPPDVSVSLLRRDRVINNPILDIQSHPHQPERQHENLNKKSSDGRSMRGNVGVYFYTAGYGFARG